MPLTLRHSHQANGIDVSDWQGDFPWHSWDGHIDFAMIKATEGPTSEYPKGLSDIQFERNWEGAKAIGVHRFAYHFFHPDHDPAAQAHLFNHTITEAGLDLPDNLVLDYEVPGEGMTVHECAFSAWVFVREMHRLRPRHTLLIYTYPAFAEMGYCAMLGGQDLWIADYGVPVPRVPVPWKSWHFWQYAPGKNGSPDLDRFNGTEHDLEVYCTR